MFHSHVVFLSYKHSNCIFVSHRIFTHSHFARIPHNRIFTQSHYTIICFCHLSFFPHHYFYRSLILLLYISLYIFSFPMLFYLSLVIVHIFVHIVFTCLCVYVFYVLYVFLYFYIFTKECCHVLFELFSHHPTTSNSSFSLFVQHFLVFSLVYLAFSRFLFLLLYIRVSFLILSSSP
jgi:hypothetical protein